MPTKAGAHMGHVVGALDRQGEQWSTLLTFNQTKEPDNHRPTQCRRWLALLRLIYPNPDRHVGPDHRTPTIEEARAVVVTVQVTHANATPAGRAQLHDAIQEYANRLTPEAETQGISRRGPRVMSPEVTADSVSRATSALDKFGKRAKPSGGDGAALLCSPSSPPPPHSAARWPVTASAPCQAMIGTLLHRLICVPAQLVRHAGVLDLRLPPGHYLLETVLTRIRALPGTP